MIFNWNSFLEKINNIYNIRKECKSYYEFLRKVESSGYNVLFRGMLEFNYLDNDSFFADFLSHAKEYAGDEGVVEGLLIGNDKILKFDTESFNDLIRYNEKGFIKLLIKNLPDEWEYDEWEDKIKEELRKIYINYYNNDKLSDAMYQHNFDLDDVINFVYDFIVDSTMEYSVLSRSKKNDFMIPYLTFYGKSNGYNIISFFGSDFYGSYEYVIHDVSRYEKLSDIWKNIS